MTIHAFTELHNNFPAFINLSEQSDGTIKVSVRARGNDGKDYATITLTALQAEELADNIYKHNYKGEGEIDRAAPPAAVQSGSGNSLFDRKLVDLERRGYMVIGRILHKDGEYALFDSSCRWLTKPQYLRLMHEQDGSLFADQQSDSERDAALSDDRAAFENFWTNPYHGDNSSIDWNEGDGYFSFLTREAYRSWQASRAALIAQSNNELRHDTLFEVYSDTLKKLGYTSIEADSNGLMAVANYAILAAMAAQNKG
jgi:hypothetical protein